MANAASNLAETSAPDFARRLNPFNVDAVINAAAPLLAADGTVPEGLRADLAAASALSPADARIYSVAGIAAEKAGDKDAARRLYDMALRLEPAEIQALLHTIVMDFADGDIASAVRKTDLIARRWPDQWALLEPHLPLLLSSDEGMSAFVEAYRASPVGRERLVGSLIANPESVELALPLLLQWKALGTAVDAKLVSRTCAALIKAGMGAAAHSLFLQMLSDEERAENGYVHNGRFALPPHGNPFDWQIIDQAGAEIRRVTPNGVAQVEARFMGNPLQFNSIWQTMRLPTGRYSLSVRFASEDLSSPKPLKAVIDCLPTRRTLAAIDFPQGTNIESVVETEFQVPLLDCELAQIRFMSDFVALSFQNRFTGVFRVFEVRARRLED